MKRNLLIIIILLIRIPGLFASSFDGFIENKGQIIDQHGNLNSNVLFFFASGDIKVQLRETGFSYEVSRADKIKNDNPFELDLYQHNIHRIDINWTDANPNPVIEKYGRSKDYLNYYTNSTPSEGITDVHYYSKVTFKNVYDQIDFEFIISDGK